MITDYASLQTEIADFLDNQQLTNRIPSFIQDAEAELKRDVRCRKLQDRPTFTVSADNAQLPSDLKSIDTLSHVGPTSFGPIHIVGMDQIAQYRNELTNPGVPAYAAVISGKLRFAPIPGGVFNLHLTYWLKIIPLSDAATTNWLLLDHPDIYRFASLLQAAPFLKDEERIPLWQNELDKRLEQLFSAVQEEQFGGRVTRRMTRSIGG